MRRWYILTKPIERVYSIHHPSTDPATDSKFQTVVTMFRRQVRAGAVEPGYDRDYEGMFAVDAWSKLEKLLPGARVMWAKGLPASESILREQRPMSWEAVERAIQQM